VRIRRFRAAASAIPRTSTTTTLGGGAALVPTAVASSDQAKSPTPAQTAGVGVKRGR
jgi:hypothetical protein